MGIGQGKRGLIRLISIAAFILLSVLLVFQGQASAGPEPAGWYAGDPHVHRSCGGAPIDLPTMYANMGAQNLAVISLLADMGNGEVQDPSLDLPRVNGQDDSVSTPGRIVHWDAEWHWDATYNQYPHQALGGHILTLGLTEANQVWDEYTYPIFQWAHQRNGIAGFAHMQALDDGIQPPDSLNCCKPIEYPVEVALGAADFISEDVGGSDSFIEAYYRLLNTGFRPGFAAGSDFPCNAAVGSLLTYVQVAGGEMTYRNWIDGIANGKTVISRNGHNEFLHLTVNNSATPGDEINLTAGGSLPVTMVWTANQDLTGTIELVKNGVVVGSVQRTVSSGASASFSTTVDFTTSGWLAARRMGSNGHQVHTAAVFVIVNGAPIRASAADAEYYVQWMDNLLAKTSPGGEWNSFFPTRLAAAQARYQQARAIFQQVALEAGGSETPPTVISVSPNSGATGVSTGTVVTVTFSEPINAATVSANTFVLRDAAGAIVPSVVAYSSGTNAATLSPSAALNNSTTYTARVIGGTGGVTDASGNPLAADYVSTFTTAASGSSTSYSVWNDTAVPAILADTDTAAVELGMKFRSSVAGYITGIKFYKGTGSTGTHVGNLWTAAGVKLAGITFSGETATGWQYQALSTPVAVSANTIYVVSYHAPVGRYAANVGYFSSGVDSNPLRALSNSESGGNGVYLYGASGFPNQTWNSCNYWVDVVFTTTNPPGDTTPPTVTSAIPSANATGVSIATQVSAVFSEPVDSATVSAATFELRTSANALVSATVTYNSSSRAAVLTPSSQLAYGATYTATVKGGTGGVRDIAGNLLTSNFVWAFTTAAAPGDAVPPTVEATSTYPLNGSTGVSTGSNIRVPFSENMNPATITSSTVILLDALGVVIPATVTYDSATLTAIIDPLTSLDPGKTYTVRIVGGAAGVADLAGNRLASNYTWSFTTGASSFPGDGPGGPILVVTSTSNPFSRYLSEVLTAEGLNAFAVQDISTVTDTLLAGYDVVVL
ncbi:MAG: Ig-like domain-containing protein, partial [Deltaproteobacteria bacterium]|nr:Ig-like domain-containing protein [Deltaproteobacteria bacterium]